MGVSEKDRPVESVEGQCNRGVRKDGTVMFRNQNTIVGDFAEEFGSNSSPALQRLLF